MNRFLLAGLAGVIASTALAQTDPNAIVLNVNGDVIKASDYWHRMEILPGVSKQMGPLTVSYPPGFLTIDTLITERLVYQLAKQKGVMPTEAEVQAELASILEENKDFLTEAALMGQSKNDVYNQIKFQMTQFKITTFGVTITDAEIDKFYKDRPLLFTTPKRFKLRVIAVSDEGTKSKVDAELESKPFADVAKAYSEDTTKESGGEFGAVFLGDLPKQVQAELTRIKIGQRTAWIDMSPTPGDKTESAVTKNTQAKFLLEDILPEQKAELTAKLRKSIRRRLMVDRGQAKNNVAKEMADLRAKAKIDISNESFAKLYKKYWDQMDKVTGGG